MKDKLYKGPRRPNRHDILKLSQEDRENALTDIEKVRNNEASIAALNFAMPLDHTSGAMEIVGSGRLHAGSVGS